VPATTDPAISVILPVFNRGPFLAQSIASVLAQTRTDWELIVWDDGSTDGSADEARRVAAGDARVRVMGGPNHGAARAVREAHTHARGRFTAWLDSDDWLAPSALEATARVLEQRPDVGMVYTDHAIVDAGGVVLGIGARCQIPYSKERLLIDFMTFHLRLFRREVYDKAGGIDTSYPSTHDYDFCLRVSEVTQIVHLPGVQYFYRKTPGAISSARRVEQIEESARAIRAALARRGHDRDYELEVEVEGRYSIRKRPKNGA
jgi:glycosyltransferase involved in cell wall biosynthesis